MLARLFKTGVSSRTKQADSRASQAAPGRNAGCSFSVFSRIDTV